MFGEWTLHSAQLRVDHGLPGSPTFYLNQQQRPKESWTRRAQANPGKAAMGF